MTSPAGASGTTQAPVEDPRPVGGLATPSQTFEGRLSLTRKGRNGFKSIFVDVDPEASRQTAGIRF